MALSKADQSLRALRHSAVALLGAALQEVFPSLQLIGGHPTSLGFVYDIVGTLPGDVTMLQIIEERMRAIAGRGLEIQSREMVRENAAEYFRHHKQPLKAEALEDYPEGLVSLIQIGDVLDLAPLPHVRSLTEVKAVCLLSSSTSIRRLPSGEELHVTSIAGTVQRDNRGLKTFVKTMKSFKETEHGVPGKELNLFTTDVSGVTLWHAQGTGLRETLLDWWRKALAERPYSSVITTVQRPNDDAPMTSRARNHALMYRSRVHSFRELPIGYMESGELFEESESLENAGLFSQAVYTCPEAHLFCRTEEAPAILQSHLRFLVDTLKHFNLESRAYVTFGRANPGDLRKRAGDWLKSALTAEQVAFEVDQEESAPEGPCIHLRVVDVMGREWLGPSLAVNIVQPETLGLRVPSELDTPVMLAMRVFGSLERWIGLILEQSQGNLPFWLAPEQIRLLPMTEAQYPYAEEVRRACEMQRLKATIDKRDERLSSKIYAFEKARVPFALILGKEEMANQQVTMRKRGDREEGQSLTLQAFLAMVCMYENPVRVGND